MTSNLTFKLETFDDGTREVLTMFLDGLPIKSCLLDHKTVVEAENILRHWYCLTAAPEWIATEGGFAAREH